MPIQASYFARLPVELRLTIYEYLFDDPKEAILKHSLIYVSDQVSEEVMPILLRRISGFFWTAIPCDEEWYLALQPRKKIWRMRLTNVSELPLDTVPKLHTKVSFHLLVGRRVFTGRDLYDRMSQNGVNCKIISDNNFSIQKHDQQDGVKRMTQPGSLMWFERGRAGAPKQNKKLTDRVWHQQWYGGYKRGPRDAWMCKLEAIL